MAPYCLTLRACALYLAIDVPASVGFGTSFGQDYNSMKIKRSLLGLGFVAVLGAPAWAAVTVSSLTPSLASPQLLGTPITWTAVGTNPGTAPLTFQFNVTPPGGSLTMIKDFNTGTQNGTTYTSQPFVWVPTAAEGTYDVQVVVKNWKSGSTAKKTVSFTVKPLATGSTPVVTPTANPLVAIFSAPACAKGSSMRVSFQQASGATPATLTSYASCNDKTTMNFEIAGMYASTAYNMFSETLTKGKLKKGAEVTYTTGALPGTFPTYSVKTPPGSSTDTAESMLLINSTQLGNQPLYPDVAVDLSGNFLWYYLASPTHGSTITHPLPNGAMLTIQYGQSWNTVSQNQQLLRQIDFAGNVIKETNTGVVQQELLALGAVDGGPCSVFPSPAPVGSACLDTFSHDAIQYTIGSETYTAVLCDLEKIFPAGTQGNTSPYPVDIRGVMIVVLNSDWQAVWYWDNFDPAGGGNGYPNLPVSQKPALYASEQCGLNEQGCEGIQLLGPGIAPLATDWVHENSIYYWGNDTSGGASGAFVWSSRNQDLVTKVDYGNGSGTGNILWTMGVCAVQVANEYFTFNNIYNTTWPWYSGQHDVEIENNGAGPMTVFDDGNTRVSPPNASTQCMPGLDGGDSRGLALTIDETPNSGGTGSMMVTPVLEQDLLYYSEANGSAALLSNGNYFFLNPVVFYNINTNVSYSMEIEPATGSDTGTVVFNLQGEEAYRAWRMTNLYNPPTT